MIPIDGVIKHISGLTCCKITAIKLIIQNIYIGINFLFFQFVLFLKMKTNQRIIKIADKMYAADIAGPV